MNPTLLQVALTAGTIEVGKGGLFMGRYVGNLPDGKPIILGVVGDEHSLNSWLVNYPTPEHWEEEYKGVQPLTESQKIVADIYSGGEYSYLLEFQYHDLRQNPELWKETPRV